MEQHDLTGFFKQLIDEDWDFRMREDPLFATMTGDHRFNDRLPGASEEDFARRLETMRTLLSRLGKIDRTMLLGEERLNYDIFVRLLENDLREIEYHAYRMPISKVFGFHMAIPEQLPFITPFETVQDYEAYLARLGTFPRYVKDHIELMRTGLDTGYAPPRTTLAGVDETIRKQIVSDHAASMLYLPFTQFPALFDGSQRDRLSSAGQAVLQKSVMPAYEALLRFFQEEYLPGARPEIGAAHLPNGQEFYQHRIRTYTSMPLTAQGIHDTGQAEVKRIRIEMDEVLRAVNFEGDLQAFVTFLRTNARLLWIPRQRCLKRRRTYSSAWTASCRACSRPCRARPTASARSPKPARPAIPPLSISLPPAMDAARVSTTSIPMT
jgi:uncharacterized protein (DUF885 family)